MEKYYYKFDSETGICTTKCNVASGDLTIKIGSHACWRSCPHCKEYNEQENWIKCERIKEATQED